MHSLTINLELAKRMRSEDLEQFYTLVRMHLSFVLDLNSEDYDINLDKKVKHLKWSLPFSKKSKGPPRSAEGSNLSPEFMEQLNCLIKHLKQPENIVQEGIFRRTGNLKRQQDLKSRLASGEQINLGESAYSVHDCASLLKSYLSELPEPLLTESLYTAYCQVSQLNKERLALALELLILLIPEENYTLIQKVVELLHSVSQNSDLNRMSTTNLATLFTPHLIWPRRIPAETLHANSQCLSKIVSFMIEETDKLFSVPDALATDIRAYFEKKERRRRSPMRQLNESVCDGTTANTVFTFVDRERTAQENGSNPTELALAQLYAHIQSLPDSARKRRLVKNFNKKNGQGTPAVRNDERSKHRRSRSLRDSIKKHLPGFGKNGGALSPSSNDSASPDVFVKSPSLSHVDDAKSRYETPRLNQRLHLKNIVTKENRDPTIDVPTDAYTILPRKSGRKRSCGLAGTDKPPKRISPGCEISISKCATSPESLSLVLPTRRSTRNLAQRSLLKSPPNANTLPQILQPTPPVGLSKISPNISPKRDIKRRSITRTKSVLAQPQPVVTDSCERSPRFPVPTPVPIAVSIGIDEHGLPCPINYLTPQRPQPRRVRHFPCTTSTPAPRASGAGFVTPYVERNASMSPITRSAQRMSRAMQETMMTPRSRKPVVSLSGSDLCHLTSLEPWTPLNAEKRLIVEESEGSHSLSSTFRDYLISRSVLTTSPADLSFSSRTDDYQSLSSKNSILEELQSLANEEMSESLLYCMEGNDPGRKSPAARKICETAI